MWIAYAADWLPELPNFPKVVLWQTGQSHVSGQRRRQAKETAGRGERGEERKAAGDPSKYGTELSIFQL